MIETLAIHLGNVNQLDGVLKSASEACRLGIPGTRRPASGHALGPDVLLAASAYPTDGGAVYFIVGILGAPACQRLETGSTSRALNASPSPSLRATLADGRTLPRWVQRNSESAGLLLVAGERRGELQT